MDERPAEQYEALAEFLHAIGWKSPNDAQWTRLRDAMPDIARLACPPSHAVVPVKKVMEQAGVFASAWSLVGTRFDDGNALEHANEMKEELRKLLVTP